jgi:hypothetical protein
MSQERACLQCGALFVASGRTSQKLYCSRSCKSRYRTTSGQAKNHHLAETFGITLEEYDQILAGQGGGCAICGKTQEVNGNRLAVDHDHSCCPSTRSCGKCVRGILCRECNRALGLFKESPEIVRSAIQYLNNPPFAEMPRELMEQRTTAPTRIHRSPKSSCEVCGQNFSAHPIGASRRRFCGQACKARARVLRGGKRDGWRWTKYRLTEPAHLWLLGRQEDGCAICGAPNGSEGKSLAVDHDSACCGTLRSSGCCIRGLLCGHCNRGLGCLSDSPLLLTRSLSYLGH